VQIVVRRDKQKTELMLESVEVNLRDEISISGRTTKTGIDN
jgi:hypothetical protein